MKNVFSFFFSFLSILCFAQNSQNLKLKKYKIAQLSDSLSENSGLAFRGSHLYTLNDGGNSSEIFELNPENGKILKSYIIPVQNTDWEALTFSETDLYIGDFGNNLGNRKDLKIYKIPFQEEKFSTDSIKTIPYFYPEQKDFSPKNINNDYDAEAMIFLNGKIHVFSKEWQSKSTTHFTLNSDITILQPAEKLENLHLGFVVSDAYYFNHQLYLLGYNKKTEAYLMICKESEPEIFFKENPKKYYLGSTLFLSQLEGLSVNENGIFISGEAFHSPFGVKKQTFYFIPNSEL